MKKTKEEYYKTEIFGRIFPLNNALQNYLDRMLKEDNLTVKQMFTMLAIDHFKDENPTLKDVAKLMQSSHQNVKQLVNKLELNEYVSVMKDVNDKRSLRISLTKKAHEYWSLRDVEHTARLDLLFQEFDEDELSSMLKGIEKLTNNIEKLEES